MNGNGSIDGEGKNVLRTQHGREEERTERIEKNGRKTRKNHESEREQGK